MSKPKTAAQRKQAQRDRIRGAGFKLVQVPVHPDDEERLQRLVSRMNKQRGLGL